MGNMAKKRGRTSIRGRSKRAFGSIGSILKKASAGLGAGLLVGTALGRIAPQFSAIGSAGAEFAVGGFPGLVLAELLKPMVSNQPSLLGGLGGGGGLSNIGGLFGMGQAPATAIATESV